MDTVAMAETGKSDNRINGVDTDRQRKFWLPTIAWSKSLGLQALHLVANRRNTSLCAKVRSETTLGGNQ
jgi:hypothetical protein